MNFAYRLKHLLRTCITSINDIISNKTIPAMIETTMASLNPFFVTSSSRFKNINERILFQITNIHI